MEKVHLNRRPQQMEAEGVKFRSGMNVGVDVTVKIFAAVTTLWCLRSERRKGAISRLPVVNSTEFTRRWVTFHSPTVCEGDSDTVAIDAAGKHVVVIGGGDTGADCLGTATRQERRPSRNLRSCPPARGTALQLSLGRPIR